MAVISSLRHNLRNLHRFRGRDPKPLFVPYAVALFILTHIVITIVMIPWMTENFVRMQQYAAAHPEKAKISTGPGHDSVRIEGAEPGLTDMSSEIVGMAMVFGLAVALSAAAVARQLNDAGRSPWWGLMPIPFVAFYLFKVPTSFSTPEDLGAFAVQFLSGLFFLGALAALAVLLAGRSEGENPEDEGTKGV